MTRWRNPKWIMGVVSGLLLASACDDETSAGVDGGGDDVEYCYELIPKDERPAGWNTDSHCNGVAPNYDLVFDDTIVHRFDITVSAENYVLTMEDLADKLSGGGPPGGSEDPIWVPVTVEYKGLTWTNVGMRYKGNSSLSSAWRDGVRKLAFRLNMDKFEDDYPEIDDQRFYGFKKLTFSNGFKDSSLFRDKLAADIFRAGGVPVARNAFAQVHVDTGNGPIYFGLYTMIEDPSDAMLDTQFADGSGNLYKPEGSTANWTGFAEADFEKKTNEESDFVDVQSAIQALLAATRFSDRQTWRSDLQEVFDVYGFLRVLAVNQAMVNWDSYGCMAHNYYLYANPAEANRLTWFPWDLNEALLTNGRPGCSPESVLLDEIGAEWPLIRYLLDDPEYRQAYLTELELALYTAMPLAGVSAKIESLHALIEPYVVGPIAVEEAPYTFLRSSQSFLSSEQELLGHVQERHTAVSDVLGR